MICLIKIFFPFVYEFVLHRVFAFLYRIESTRGSLLKIIDQLLWWLYQIWAILCVVSAAGEKYLTSIYVNIKPELNFIVTTGYIVSHLVNNHPIGHCCGKGKEKLHDYNKLLLISTFGPYWCGFRFIPHDECQHHFFAS